MEDADIKRFLPDLYCTLEVDAFGYFVNKAKTRVYRDSTEPCWNEVSLQRPLPETQPLAQQGGPWWTTAVSAGVSITSDCVSPPQEFEIELEGSQTLRLLCYEKCCGRTRQSRDEGENTERIVAKGQITVGGGALGGGSQC